MSSTIDHFRSKATPSGLPAPIDSVYDLLSVSVPAPSNGAIDNLIHLSPDQENPPPLPSTAAPELHSNTTISSSSKSHNGTMEGRSEREKDGNQLDSAVDVLDLLQEVNMAETGVESSNGWWVVVVEMTMRAS